MKKFLATGVVLVLFSTGAFSQKTPAFRNTKLPLQTRVKSLVASLTVEEKISLLGYKSKGVPRLNIPAYNWWNEALHGVARAGLATVFPQAIAMSATFDDSLVHGIGNVISTEARAKYNIATGMNKRQQYMGLTFWSPNINIFRDPRWGRGQETYGEDPFLTAAMGVSFVKGLQGNDPDHLKTAACAKHFAVHSGPEAGRHAFNAIVDQKDLHETYLYAFKKLVDANVASVMCAYNRLNGEPCCTGDALLKNTLREEWGFKGYIVTDCGALDDIIKFHKTTTDRAVVAADALKAGVNLDCSTLLQTDLIKAYNRKLISDEQIDSALGTLLTTQFKLGFYDDPKKDPYRNLGASSLHTAASVNLSRKAAQESMVLLKNDKNILPLGTQQYNSIMVVGANAGAMDPLVANYHGMSGNMVTFAEGITAAVSPGVSVQYDQGSDFTDTLHFGGIWAAGESDIVIAVIGLTPVLEGEEGDAFLAANGGDRLSLDLPKAHVAMLKQLHKKGKPVIVVVTAGSNVNIAEIEPYADAIILAWYPGEQGGNALADLVFGKVSPSGRLPVTFYKSLGDLPEYNDYKTSGRTYRYFNGPVQYPFGFGLSYTSFTYHWETKPASAYSMNQKIDLKIKIKNTGDYDGAEVAQMYLKYPSGERMPVKELKGFKRKFIKKGSETVVSFSLPVQELKKWDLASSQWKIYPGNYTIKIGPDSHKAMLVASCTISAN